MSWTYGLLFGNFMRRETQKGRERGTSMYNLRRQGIFMAPSIKSGRQLTSSKLLRNDECKSCQWEWQRHTDIDSAVKFLFLASCWLKCCKLHENLHLFNQSLIFVVIPKPIESSNMKLKGLQGRGWQCICNSFKDCGRAELLYLRHFLCSFPFAKKVKLTTKLSFSNVLFFIKASVIIFPFVSSAFFP